MPSASRTINAYLAIEHRRKQPDPERIAELREQLREAQLTEWVERQLDRFPPLGQATRGIHITVAVAWQRAAAGDWAAYAADISHRLEH